MRLLRPAEKWTAFYRHNRGAALFSAAAVLVVFFFFGGVGTVFMVEATSTPGFCTSCHELEPYGKSWLAGPHFRHKSTAGAPAAACRDCHLPAWDNPAALFSAKAYHGLKDLYHHFADDKKEMGLSAYRFRMKQYARNHSIRNAYCLRCHQTVSAPAYGETEPSARRNVHLACMRTPDFRCVKCHASVGHE